MSKARCQYIQTLLVGHTLREKAADTTHINKRTDLSAIELTSVQFGWICTEVSFLWTDPSANCTDVSSLWTDISANCTDVSSPWVDLSANLS